MVGPLDQQHRLRLEKRAVQQHGLHKDYVALCLLQAEVMAAHTEVRLRSRTYRQHVVLAQPLGLPVLVPDLCHQEIAQKVQRAVLRHRVVVHLAVVGKRMQCRANKRPDHAHVLACHRRRRRCSRPR